MKTMLSAALGLSLIIGSAALSFGAQDPAAPAKTETKTSTVESTKTTEHKARKHPKKMAAEQKSTTTSTTTTTPSPTK